MKDHGYWFIMTYLVCVLTIITIWIISLLH